MKIRVSGRARVRIRKHDDWWRTHRLDAPDLFKEELASAFERILRAPTLDSRTSRSRVSRYGAS